MSEWGTDLPFAPVPMWVIELEISDRAKVLYALLAGMRDYGTGKASFGRALLAKKLGCSEDSLDRAKSELLKHQAISVEAGEARGGAIPRNVYTVHRIPPASRTGAATAIAAPERLPDSRTGAAMDEKNSLNEKNLKTYTQIADAWLSRIELIAHRPTYFEDAKVQREIDKAVKRYGLDDVIAAITSYATVLASPAHFWNHSWTLKDFLVRGLDRFVPEAKPEQVFRQNGGGTSDGDEKIPTKYARDDDD